MIKLVRQWSFEERIFGGMYYPVQIVGFPRPFRRVDLLSEVNLLQKQGPEPKTVLSPAQRDQHQKECNRWAWECSEDPWHTLVKAPKMSGQPISSQRGANNWRNQGMSSITPWLLQILSAGKCRNERDRLFRRREEWSRYVGFRLSPPHVS